MHVVAHGDLAAVAPHPRSVGEFLTFHRAVSGPSVRAQSGWVRVVEPESAVMAMVTAGIEVPTTLADMAAAASAAAAVREVVAGERNAAFRAVVESAGYELYPHQEDGIRRLAALPAGGAMLLADDQGLGKTLQLCGSWDRATGLLVVCPALVKGVWRAEVERWLATTAVVLQGRKSFRWPSPGEVVVVNYDVLPKDPGPAPRSVLLALDEMHLAANPRAKRHGLVKTLVGRVRAAGGIAVGMTGTPERNSPEEFYAVLDALGLAESSCGSWGRFVRERGGRFSTFSIGNRRIPRWTWGRPSERYQKLVGPVVLRRRKDDVINLPPMRFQRVPVSLDKNAARVCDAALKTWDAVDSSRTRLPPIERFSAARAALAAVKAAAADELVGGLLDAGEQVVVFSAHLDPLRGMAERRGGVMITGEQSHAERSAAAVAFQSGAAKLACCTYRGGGVGVTLTAAAYVVFVDRPWTPADEAQARDRIRRIGQTRSTLVYICVADHALDQRVDEILDRKLESFAVGVDALADNQA